MLQYLAHLCQVPEAGKVRLRKTIESQRRHNALDDAGLFCGLG